MYSIYNLDTGKIELITNQPLQGLPCIEGEYDPRHYRVVNGVPVAETPQLDLDALAITQRQQRDQLLSQVDRVNPIWYGSLTNQQQSELAQYRQCLLDVPQQPGWPESVTWPRVPTWL